MSIRALLVAIVVANAVSVGKSQPSGTVTTSEDLQNALAGLEEMLESLNTDELPSPDAPQGSGEDDVNLDEIGEAFGEAFGAFAQLEVCVGAVVADSAEKCPEFEKQMNEETTAAYPESEETFEAICKDGCQEALADFNACFGELPDLGMEEVLPVEDDISSMVKEVCATCKWDDHECMDAIEAKYFGMTSTDDLESVVSTDPGTDEGEVVEDVDDAEPEDIVYDADADTAEESLEEGFEQLFGGLFGMTEGEGEGEPSAEEMADFFGSLFGAGGDDYGSDDYGAGNDDSLDYDAIGDLFGDLFGSLFEIEACVQESTAKAIDPLSTTYCPEFAALMETEELPEDGEAVAEGSSAMYPASQQEYEALCSVACRSAFTGLSICLEPVIESLSSFGDSFGADSDDMTEGLVQLQNLEPMIAETCSTCTWDDTDCMDAIQAKYENMTEFQPNEFQASALSASSQEDSHGTSVGGNSNAALLGGLVCLVLFSLQ